MKVDAFTHYSGAFLNLETGKNEGEEGSPSPQGHTHIVCMCSHCPGNILFGVRPQPAPFQSKGRGWWHAHSQAGLTQGRGMRGAGTAAQVALLRSWNPPGLTLSPLHSPPPHSDCAAGQPRSQDSRVFRGSKSQPLAVPTVKPRPTGPGLPMGTEPRAYVKFILLEARQKKRH